MQSSPWKRASARAGAVVVALAVSLGCFAIARAVAPSRPLDAASDLGGLPRRAGRPLEKHAGVVTDYGALRTPRGLLRTIVTYPAAVAAPLPAILVVGWLSCDSAEIPPGASAGFARVLEALVERSGALVYRVDKPGTGDSEGVCSDTDFATELTGYRAAFAELRRLPRVDARRIVVVGLSNGGGVLPLVTDGAPVAGYVVSGGWYETWFEHMMDLERRRLTLSGKSPLEISTGMRSAERLYDLYLNERRLPGDVVREHPELAGAWDDEPDHQYGRPAAFYQQLQALDLAEAWSHVDAPVLAVHGDQDWIMSREDHELIVRDLNLRHPQSSVLVELPGMDHFYMQHDSPQAAFRDKPVGTYDDRAATRIVAWLRERFGS